MSQAVGVVLNLLGISGLFQNSLDYLDQVRLARQFGNDFPRCLMTLDVLKLRLARWADTVGALDQNDPFSQIADQEGDKKLLIELIGNILVSFENARRVSENFEVNAEPEQLEFYEEDSLSWDLTDHFKYVHAWAVAKTNSYRKNTSLIKKTTWALYQKKHLEKLIALLAKDVDVLIELFPRVKQEQKDRCTVEIAEIHNVDSLLLIHDAASTTDYILRDAAKSAIVRKGGHTWGNTKIRDYGTIHQGDQVAAGQRPIGNRHVFGDTDVSGEGISSQGDRVGMSDIIADAIAKRHEMRMKSMVERG